MIIDVAIPGDGNMIEKEAEKILKYNDLIIEIQHMWNVKAKVILVITGNWNHFKTTQTVPGKHKIMELQKIAVLGIAHILQKVPMNKYKTYFMGEITLHVAQTVNTEHLQHCIP
jgi:hypothetical protein